MHRARLVRDDYETIKTIKQEASDASAIPNVSTKDFRHVEVYITQGVAAVRRRRARVDSILRSVVSLFSLHSLVVAWI